MLTVKHPRNAFLYAKVSEGADGVSVELWKLPRWSGNVASLVERGVVNAPFHLVCVSIYEQLAGMKVPVG